MYVYPLVRNLWLHLELKLFSCVSDTSSCLSCLVLAAALGREILCHHLLWPLLSLLFLPTIFSASSGSWYYKHGAVWLGRCWDLGFSLRAYFVDSLKPFAPHPPSLGLSLEVPSAPHWPLSLYAIKGTPQPPALISLLGKIQDIPLLTLPYWLHPAQGNHSCILSWANSG